MPYEATQTNIEIRAGDDYSVSEGRGLSWFNPEYPALAGAKLTFTFGTLASDTNVFSPIPVVWTSTMPSSPATHVATLELTKAQTMLVEEGSYNYVLVATLLDGHTETLAYGRLTIQSTPGQWGVEP